MISISRRVLRFLPIVSTFAACASLLICASLLSGCGGGGSNGGGGNNNPTNYTITVASANPTSGVSISYGNSNNALLTTGTTPFSLNQTSGATVIFSAPATAGNNNFSSWSGCTSTSGASCTVTVGSNATITANYVTPVAPTVTVTPSPATITTVQTLSVTVAVAASQGGATPTGSVVLTSGSYTSATTSLSSGSATISIPAGTLATGTDSLKATYTPDSLSPAYTSSSGTASVTVNPLPGPTMSIALSSSSITTAQSLTATVTVSGTPMPTGGIVLTSGSYTSSSTALSSGVAVITVPAGSLAAGTDTLTATYTPDSSSSSTYGSGTKTASVTVSYAITVATTNPASGVSITVSPKDVNGNGSGSSPISLAYAPNTTVTLTAPAKSSTGNPFGSWTGCGSTSGTPALTCTLNVTAATTVTANYTTPLSVTVTPSSSVTIGQSQQFTATVTGLSPATVTWSVAVASGSGSAGTITTGGFYQTPYPAPASVTITATSTANTSINGSVTVNLVAPATAAGPALTIDANPNDGNPSNPTCASSTSCPISPLIYGMNGYLLDPATAQNANITVVRWGGDDTSRYNYQTNVVNSASDYFFENFQGANSMLPNGANGQGTSFNAFISETNTLGVKSIGTAPVLGWVSNNALHSSTATGCSFPKTGLNGQASYPNQQSYNNDGCGNGAVPNGPNGITNLFGDNTVASFTSIVTPPPTVPSSGSASPTWAETYWIGGWVNCLMNGSTNGTNYCTNGSGNPVGDATIWDLDNEPAWWDAVHRDVHPNPSTYDEVTNGGIGTALAIKEVDKNALVSGPVIDNWWNYFYSKQDMENGWAHGPCNQPWDNPTDRAAHNGTPMMVYYLQQMASASNTYGMRLLDYLTIHAYVAGSYNGLSVSFNTAGDTGEQQARMNSTRALWDSTYTDPHFPQPNYTTDSNYTSSCSVPLQALQIIPMMQSWISSGWKGTTYAQPGTSIDEYNFGGTEAINGAVTEADVLGIFGKYGLTMGVLWPSGPGADPTQGPGNMAFEMYRNYDGNKSTFGDVALSSNSTLPASQGGGNGQGQLSVYAASRTSDGAVTIMVINKTYGPLTDTLSINNLTSTATQASVYQYSNANLNAISSQPAATITPPASGSTASTISATLPGQSITLFVIPPH